MLQTSGRILRSRRELLAFPILAGAVSIVVVIGLTSLAGLLAVYDAFSAPVLVLVPVGYFAVAYVTVFFNAALVSQADVALRGGDPSVAAGVGAAAQKWARLVPWAITAATVSGVLRMLRDRASVLQDLLVGAVGVAWDAVTFLVLPKLVFENSDFAGTVRSAASELRDTWGENVIGTVSLGTIRFVLAVPGLVMIWLGGYVGGTAEGIAFISGAVWLVGSTILVAALNGIYQAALYRFIKDGRAAGAFGATDLQAAFVAG
ncbi:hypothetical protein FOS14_23135 [Skermania sp. ID1734]|uniref:DUF6159 family protein n=1 Tax=Skermania sp. ID1734 TaxID=2597516 RepID=UPI00117EE3E1|nr:DUF6159 family protein [Skermania sp. ID1734]TSD93449.1 hypothetical protein FOS14_23135 [Skermania sp. ID1734]